MTENDKQTESRIFEAASEVFLEKGMDGARMQDIADRAGINKSLLHYYYRTKDHLFDTVFEKTVNQMLMRFAPVFDQNLTFEEKIRFFFHEHIDFLMNNRRLPSFLLNEINRNPERMTKLMEKIEVHKLWDTLHAQHKKELNAYNINREDFPQIMVSVAALSLFPFAGFEIVSRILEKHGTGFDEFIEKRKDFATQFVIKALKK